MRGYFEKVNDVNGASEVCNNQQQHFMYLKSARHPAVLQLKCNAPPITTAWIMAAKCILSAKVQQSMC